MTTLEENYVCLISLLGSLSKYFMYHSLSLKLQNVKPQKGEPLHLGGEESPPGAELTVGVGGSRVGRLWKPLLCISALARLFYPKVSKLITSVPWGKMEEARQERTEGRPSTQQGQTVPEREQTQPAGRGSGMRVLR